MTQMAEAPVASLPPVRPASRRKSTQGSRWTPYLFMAPAAVYLLVFMGVPLVQELRLSFTRTSLLTPNENVWVGLQNFTDLIGEEQFRSTLLTTGIYVVACVVLSIGVGLGTALMLNMQFRGRGFARSLITIPWAAPSVAIALITSWMLNAQYGIVNRALEGIGLGVPNGSWLDSQTFAMPAILATTIWSLFPFTTVVLLAALQAVPQEVKEAAMVDGAGKLWVFRVVTWPSIKPSVAMLTLLMTIWSLRRFELIWLLTQGGPVNSTRTLVIDLYSRAFQGNDIGKAAAIGMVGVVISLLVVGVYASMTRAAEKENPR
jgi:multiple sugar transport system permease protein